MAWKRIWVTIFSISVSFLTYRFPSFFSPHVHMKQNYIYIYMNVLSSPKWTNQSTTGENLLCPLLWNSIRTLRLPVRRLVHISCRKVRHDILLLRVGDRRRQFDFVHLGLEVSRQENDRPPVWPRKSCAGSGENSGENSSVVCERKAWWTETGSDPNFVSRLWPLILSPASRNGPCCLCLFCRRQGMVHVAFVCFTDVKGWSMLPLSVLQVSRNGTCCLCFKTSENGLCNLCLFYRCQGMVHVASVLQTSRNGPSCLCLFYRRQGMVHVAFVCFTDVREWSMLPLSVLQTSRNGPSCLCLFYKEAVFSASGLSQLKAHHKIGHEIPSPTWGKTRSRDV